MKISLLHENSFNLTRFFPFWGGRWVRCFIRASGLTHLTHLSLGLILNDGSDISQWIGDPGNQGTRSICSPCGWLGHDPYRSEGCLDGILDAASDGGRRSKRK